MSTRNDGGDRIPAFPETWGNSDSIIANPGMTLRDYYIAHAPSKKWDWYKPVVEGYPYQVPEYRFDDRYPEKTW